MRRGRVVKHETNGKVNERTTAWPTGTGREKGRKNKRKRGERGERGEGREREKPTEKRGDTRWRKKKRKTGNSNAQCPDNAPVVLGPTNGPNHHHHGLHFDSSHHLSLPLALLPASFFFLSSLPLSPVTAATAAPPRHRSPIRSHVQVLLNYKFPDRSFTFPFTFPHDGFCECVQTTQRYQRRRGDNSGVNDKRDIRYWSTLQKKFWKFCMQSPLADYYDSICYYVIHT